MIYVVNEQEQRSVTDELVGLIKRVAAATLQHEGVSDEVEASVVLVDDAYMQELNAEYRGKNCPTDVLSFAMEEGEAEIDYDGQAPDFRLLGDIVISLETAARQAQEYDHSYERELSFLTVHGMLHLLGYDHGTDEDDDGLALMEQKQEAVLGGLGLTRG